MKDFLKVVLVIIGVLIAMSVISSVVTHFMAQKEVEKSTFQYTKAEYVDEATKGCAKEGNPEEYCRCFYSAYLENHTVSEALKLDADANADTNYQPDQEVMSLVAKCLE